MRPPRLWLAAAALLVLAACDQPKPRPPASNEDMPPVANAAVKAPAAPNVPPAPKTSTDPLPKAPGWAGALLGRTFTAAFPRNDGHCVGNTDIVDMRYQGATPGVMIEGWGWDQDAKQPVPRVILVDKDGQIVGGGETGKLRADVTAARKAVTSARTGWTAVTPVTSGAVAAYGVVGEGRTCTLGRIDLGH